jgi:hypothetical protein
MEGQMEMGLEMSKPRQPSGADAFGCCHRYRDCSATGRCLIPEISYSEQCTYRYNLESGHVFYTEHATNFSQEEYRSILDKIDALPTAALRSLDAILLDICEYNRGSLLCVIRNENISELDTLGLFRIRPLAAAFPALCAYRKLSPLILADDRFSAAFQDAKAKRKEQIAANPSDKNLSGERSKEFLEAWLNTEGVECRDQFSAPYRFLSIIPDQTIYVEEIYRLRWPWSRTSDRVYHMSPLAEDNLLPDSIIEDEQKRLDSTSIPEERPAL